jgi:hypothetical protein
MSRHVAGIGQIEMRKNHMRKNRRKETSQKPRRRCEESIEMDLENAGLDVKWVEMSPYVL